MNVIPTHAKMVPHVMTNLMGTPATVLMDTMELTVNQVSIQYFYIILFNASLPIHNVITLKIYIVTFLLFFMDAEHMHCIIYSMRFLFIEINQVVLVHKFHTVKFMELLVIRILSLLRQINATMHKLFSYISSNHNPHKKYNS